MANEKTDKELNNDGKSDPRKNPKPGYDEKNPHSKKDVQEHPEKQNSG